MRMLDKRLSMYYNGSIVDGSIFRRLCFNSSKCRTSEMPHKETSVKDFWSRVRVMSPQFPDSSCWVWVHRKDYQNYANYKAVSARRCAVIIYHGFIPGNVTMSCGNRLCVRKEHISWIGNTFNSPTVYKNARGNSLTIPKHKNRELGAKIAAYRRERGYWLVSAEELAKVFNVDESIVKKIIRDSVLYDLLADVQRYNDEGRQVPQGEWFLKSEKELYIHHGDKWFLK